MVFVGLRAAGDVCGQSRADRLRTSRVEIKGQACAADICKNIDISLAAPVTKSPQVDELKGLIPVVC